MQTPSVLYNGMIAPLIPFSIRGAIWYQGESNHTDGMLYVEKTKALVEGWRELWRNPDLNYLFVQIAPYNYGGGESLYTLPEFWEAQTAILDAIPGSGMAVTTDLVDNLKDIHPKNKKDVGRRLALLALSKTYGRKFVVCSGPTFKALSIEGDKLRVSFDNVGSGLASRDGGPLSNFEIIDADSGGFVRAEATIDGTSVVLSSPKVGKPVAMRFAWSMLAQPNLMNREGLPARSFRAGQLPSREIPENLLRGSDDLTDISWEDLRANASVARSDALDPDGKTEAFRLIIKHGYLGQRLKAAIPKHSYAFSAWMKSATGEPQSVSLAGESNPPAQSANFKPFELSDQWKRVFIVFERPEGGNSDFRFSFRDGDVLVWHPQVEDITGKLHLEPGPYIENSLK